MIEVQPRTERRDVGAVRDRGLLDRAARRRRADDAREFDDVRVVRRVLIRLLDESIAIVRDERPFGHGRTVEEGAPSRRDTTLVPRRPLPFTPTRLP